MPVSARRLAGRLRRTLSPAGPPARPGTGPAAGPAARSGPAVPELPPFAPGARTRLVVGPANFAGQGYLWGQAAQRHLDSVSALAFTYDKGSFAFPVDLTMPTEVYRSAAWGHALAARMRLDVTHALVEGMRPMLGVVHGNDCWGDLPVLAQAGVRVALVCHGSEVRDPSRHARDYPSSPFPDADPVWVANLQRQSDRNRAIAQSFSGPVFVSTPDLLDDVPGAQWLPVVVDPDRWAAGQPALARPRPVLLVAPTSARIKGIDAIEDALAQLEAAGDVEVVRIADVPADRMPALVAGADIVVDQFRLGAYGVAAVEAMAAGRVVLGHVHPRVRDRIPVPVPIVETTAQTFGQSVRAVLADRPEYAAVAARGPGFVRELHDGRRSAGVLAPFLASPPGPP
jgi:hypothetical protein